VSIHAFTPKGKRGAAGDSRCTPPEIWEPALKAARLTEWDLDPASNSFSTIPCKKKWYGVKNDGLSLPWVGNIWINPPFSSISPWVEKALDEVASGEIETLTMLTSGDAGTSWWKSLARSADVWCPWHKRHHFPTPNQHKGSPGGVINLFFFDLRPVKRVLYWEKVMRSVGNLTFKYEKY